MKERRAARTGSVEVLPSGKARVIVREPGMGKVPLGTFADEETARRELAAHLRAKAALGEQGSSEVFTLRALGRQFLDHREHVKKARGISVDRDRWGAHIDTAFFSTWALTEITARDIRRWRDELSKKKATKPAPGGTKTNPRRVETKRRVSRSTVKNTLNLLRVALEYAVEEDLINANPASGVKLEKELRTEEPWTFLHPDEQTSLLTCAAIPLPERLIIQFAIGTGMRKGEIWSLRIADVDVHSERPHVMVRYGSPGKPPKNGKIRRVPLFGNALEAAKRWLKLLPTYSKRNPLQLMFPTRRGLCRHRRLFRAEVRDGEGKRAGKTLHWPDMLRAAGIARRVRIHDLRHTCGSSLVAGWWGRAWTLVEVRDLLGHSSITVTERYAHLAQSALETAAYATASTVPSLSHGPTSAHPQEKR